MLPQPPLFTIPCRAECFPVLDGRGKNIYCITASNIGACQARVNFRAPFSYNIREPWDGGNRSLCAYVPELESNKFYKWAVVSDVRRRLHISSCFISCVPVLDHLFFPFEYFCLLFRTIQTALLFPGDQIKELSRNFPGAQFIIFFRNIVALKCLLN